MKKKTLGFHATAKTFPAETPVLLPQTPEEFDTFAAHIVKAFGLPDSDQTKCQIGEMICHLPKTQDTEKLSYFAAGVRRGIAHLVAYNKCEEFYKPLREAQKQKEAEEKAAKEQSKTKLSVVTDGASAPDEQPVQGA